MNGRPQRVVVTFNGIDYEMDLAAVRLALTRRQIEGEFHRKEELSVAVGRSRSTVSRWFAGKSTSLPVALALLEKLELSFDDVYRRSEVEV